MTYAAPPWRPPPRWARRLAILAAAWLAALVVLGGPGLITTFALLNDLLFALAVLTAVGVGLWWAITARQAPRLVRVAVGVPLIPLAPVSVLPLLFLVTCGPRLGARYGESPELQRVSALPLPSGGEAVVYRDGTGGATVAFSISVRHERPLGAGLRLSRRLHHQYGASDAALRIDARGDLLIDPDEGGVVRRRLRRFVYF